MNGSFQAFNQADASTTLLLGGGGLGLSVYQWLARLLGDDVTCESRLGIASIFKLIFRLLSLRKAWLTFAEENGDR